MASVDYIVTTFPRTERVEALEPHILATFEGGKNTILYGFKAVNKEGVTYGTSRDGARSLIAGTGAAAVKAMELLDRLKPEDLSVARIDVQETIIVKHPDAIIALLTPKKSYKSIRITNIYEDGMTLYVGAPSSRARLRVYNKTAESGMSAGDDKYLRVEVQLRDSYADQAYRHVVDGKAGSVLSFWIEKMLDEISTKHLEQLLQSFPKLIMTGDEGDTEGWIERRKRWFETSVLPAMAKLFLFDPDYAKTATEMLLEKGKKGDNRG